MVRTHAPPALDKRLGSLAGSLASELAAEIDGPAIGGANATSQIGRRTLTNHSCSAKQQPPGLLVGIAPGQQGLQQRPGLSRRPGGEVRRGRELLPGCNMHRRFIGRKRTAVGNLTSRLTGHIEQGRFTATGEVETGAK